MHTHTTHTNTRSKTLPKTHHANTNTLSLQARYIEQHSLPFRRGLTDKRFNAHIARIAEGEFAAWFGEKAAG